MFGFIKGIRQFLLLILALPAFVNAQSIQWLDDFSQYSIDQTFVHQVITYDGYVYAAGADVTTGAFVIKYAPGGGQIWRRNYAIDDVFAIQAYAIAADASGVYIAGGQGPQAFVIALSHQGQDRWLYEYQGVDGAEASFKQMTINSAGLFLSGSYQHPDTDQKGNVIARLESSLGDPVWVRETSVTGIENFTRGALVSGTAGIYLADGFNAGLQRYSFDGKLLAQQASTKAIVAMDWFNGSLYTLESSLDLEGNIVGDYMVNRYLDGGQATLLHEFKPPYSNTGAYLGIGQHALKVQQGSIFVVTAQYANCCIGEIDYRVAQLDLTGQLQNQALFESFSIDSTTAVSLAVTPERIYLGGSQVRLGQSSGFVAQVSLATPISDTSKPKLLALSDINYDGYQDYAVLVNELDTTGMASLRAYVQSVGQTASLQQNIGFDLVTFAVDAELLPDVNANLAPELAVLGKYTNVVELRDSLTGEYVNIVDFDTDISAHKLLVLPDQNGNGAPELAVLGSYENNAATFVEIKDSVTGDAVGKVSFNPTFTPKDLALVQDQDGDGQPELALLGVKESKGFNKIEVRSLQGQLIKNIWPGNRFTVQHFAKQPAGIGAKPVAANLLAVVQKKENANGLQVATVDVALGRVVSYRGLNWQFTPIKSLMLEDINGNASPEVAMLSDYQKLVSGVTTSVSKVEIIDSKTGDLHNQLWQPRNSPAYDIAAVADLTGNGAQEVATLMELNGKLVVRVQDGASQQQLHWLPIAQNQN